MSPLTKLPAVFRDKLVQSRFFTISATLHLILLAILATTIYYKVSPPPEKGDMVSDGLIDNQTLPPRPPTEPVVTIKLPDPTQQIPNPQADPLESLRAITSINPNGAVLPDFGAGMRISKTPISEPRSPNPGPQSPQIGQLSREDLGRIGMFTNHRVPGKSTEFEFTAFLGRYQGGNWNSTVRVANGEITGGSLPNLLYCTSKWSKDRIKTNERNVKALDLASDELLTARPPFIFLTGTRDFVLSDKEIENLQKYIRCGGAVWGDSSVPGRRSAFDVAFCREMKRVMGDQSVGYHVPPAALPGSSSRTSTPSASTPTPMPPRRRSTKAPPKMPSGPSSRPFLIPKSRSTSSTSASFTTAWSIRRNPVRPPFSSA